MLVVTDIVDEIVEDIVVLRDYHKFFQPVTTDQEGGEAALVVGRRRNQSAEGLDLLSGRILRLIPAHSKFGQKLVGIHYLLRRTAWRDFAISYLKGGEYVVLRLELNSDQFEIMFNKIGQDD